MPRLFATAALVLLSGAAQAGYTLVPVTIPVAGATNIALSTINSAGDFAGTYQLGGTTYGFAEYQGTFQTLPPIPGTTAFPQPTAITLGGTIAGVYEQTSGAFGTGGFVYAHGTYTTPIFGPFGLAGRFGLTDSGHAYFWYTPDAGIYLSYIGTATKLVPFTLNLHQPYYLITSMNQFGDIAGQAFYEPFVCLGLSCREFLPPSKMSNPGPVAINDAGQVAGVIEGRAANRVFLYDHGVLTIYKLTGPYEVGGISDDGTIAGVASDFATAQVFVLKHGKTLRFGKFSGYPTVVGITHDDRIGIVDASGSYIAVDTP